ncbi:hydrogenase formation protein HypD [Clostridium sp.]|uniref:hydrogenase formation protein HypD n=1 Tax=Clostridium sp. TaxID=1506 RepID=UPI003D6D6FD0
MKFIDEFRNEVIAKKLIQQMSRISLENINIMEVCGTHTMALFKYGIPELLPKGVRIISGPGCPVCVTSADYIESAIEISHVKNVIILSFGDMLKVTSNENGSLLKRKSQGGDIRMIYSPMDALKIAADNPLKKVVFLSVGFEPTTSIIAVAVIEAYKQNINNLFFLTSNKITTSALKELFKDKETNIQGFLLPGHVSTIIGEKSYNFLQNDFKIPSVIAGFELLDLLQGINTLLLLIVKNKALVINEYKRAVKREGNIIALNYINEVFKVIDCNWRGIGMIPSSGYALNEKYEKFDALKHFNIEEKIYEEKTGCICGEILKGIKTPSDCKLFGSICTEENPIGPCMVSSEGTCAAHFKYSIG